MQRMNGSKKIKVCVVTATRAEYGLLRPVIRRMQADTEFEVSIAVTGMHLSTEFGLTYSEIEQDGLQIDKKIEILLSADTGAAVSKAMGLALIGFADYFAERNFDLLLLLGDRYEVLAVAEAAMNANLPIAHLHGGEITAGAADDAIRHAITKLSYLHFTSTEEYRHRVIQLGESPDRVFCVGATGVENIESVPKMSRQELSENLGVDLSQGYAVVTFHPVTLENATAAVQVQELLKALSAFPDWQFIITKANADKEGRIINQMIDEYAAEHSNTHVFTSLGMRRYLSALQHADAVIGNSSSGLLEAPSFHIPTVNIGDRQKGRVKGASVFDCQPEAEDIIRTIKIVRSKETIANIQKAINPYKGDKGDGRTTSQQIVSVIKNTLHMGVDLKKFFYNL